jgi:hypothetical protein
MTFHDFSLAGLERFWIHPSNTISLWIHPRCGCAQGARPIWNRRRKVVDREKDRVPAAVVAAAFVVVGCATPAYAYLDPASGAAATSAILGFFAAILYTARKYFHRIARLLRGGGRAEEPK